MSDLPLILLTGVLGSSHCLGMCGGFAFSIGSRAPSWRVNLGRQLAYSGGRLFTYAVLGAAAGFGGWRLARAAPGLTRLPALLAIVAGVLLVYQGLLAAGLFARLGVRRSVGPCLGSTFFATFLTSPRWGGAFLAGLFTGLLPCGLLYGMLALAASRQELVQGSLTMAAFGLGTVPLMALTGCSGSLLALSWRQRLFRLAAWCVVVTGAISIVRGIAYLQTEATCPLCG